MTDLTTLTNDAMDLGRASEGSRTAERLEPGLVHLEFPDSDGVFLVEITRVPTRRMLAEPREVGNWNGVQVHLLDVTVDNRISVVLEGRPAKSEQQRHSGPSWPADALMQLGLSLTDDLGTNYEYWTGASGGEDHPWLAVRTYRPTPPPAAAELRLQLTTDVSITSVNVALS